MKIGIQDLKTQSPLSPSGERKPAVAGKAGGGAAPQPSATVSLSAAASMQAEAGAVGSFDQAKVERIAAAIRSGSFQMNAGAIADKLIANAQELLGAGKR